LQFALDILIAFEEGKLTFQPRLAAVVNEIRIGFHPLNAILKLLKAHDRFGTIEAPDFTLSPLLLLRMPVALDQQTLFLLRHGKLVF
jgi:hypothetical protein